LFKVIEAVRVNFFRGDRDGDREDFVDRYMTLCGGDSKDSIEISECDGVDEFLRQIHFFCDVRDDVFVLDDGVVHCCSDGKIVER